MQLLHHLARMSRRKRLSTPLEIVRIQAQINLVRNLDPGVKK